MARSTINTAPALVDSFLSALANEDGPIKHLPEADARLQLVCMKPCSTGGKSRKMGRYFPSEVPAGCALLFLLPQTCEPQNGRTGQRLLSALQLLAVPFEASIAVDTGTRQHLQGSHDGLSVKESSRFRVRPPSGECFPLHGMLQISQGCSVSTLFVDYGGFSQSA